MKKWQKFFGYILTAILLFGLSAGSVSAAEKSAYTYRITFYAGNIGTFKDADGLVISNENAVVTVEEDKLVVSGLNLGDFVAFNAQANMKLDATSKHYVQGVRLSGYDNDTVAASVFEVERDRDYVVAYGIKGDMTSYTIKYQDNYGNTLASDEIYYGNVGDKPVVPYLYINGYIPRYLGLTKTLSANNAENIFVFIYDRIPEDEAPTVPDAGTTDSGSAGTGTGAGEGTGTSTGTTPGTGSAGTGTGTSEGTGTGAGTGTGTTPGIDNENEQDTEEGQDNETDQSEEPDNEEETDDSIILDLDDEEVPLAPGDDIRENREFGLKLFGCIGLGVAALGVLAYIIVLMLKKRTKQSEN